MEDWSKTLIDMGTAYGIRIIGAIAILVLGRVAFIAIAAGVRRLMKRISGDETLTRFVVSLTRILLMTVVIMAALDQLGVQTTSLVAILGAAGLAVGLALQGSLGNFASGVMLIIFRPFKAGDYVEAGGASGTIEAVQIFNTTMRTLDNKRVIVPNSQITSNTITNYSANDTRRIDLVFGISYGDDLRKAKSILEKLLRADPRILTDPAPTVGVLELAESSVNMAVRPWVKTPDYLSVQMDLQEKVKLTFDEQGISIPFPQRDIHMHQVTVA